MTTGWSKSLAIAALLGALMLTMGCVYDSEGKRRPLTDEERTALVLMLML